MIWVLAPVGVAAAALSGLYFLCRAASQPLFDEQFRYMPPTRAAYTLNREPLVCPTDFGPVTLQSGEVIVTAQGVRIPLSLFPNEAELDGWLATLEEIDRIGAEA